MSKRIAIIGAGPAGLGAAYRLQELGYDDWVLYEKNNYVGGLAASFRDEHGFTWDIGGHVLFSRYEYFTRLVLSLLGDEYLEHERVSWVRVLDTWVPYPFQNNIRYLPPAAQLECVLGLLDAALDGRDPKSAKNFRDWTLAVFGEGIAQYFMLPYNFKVWAYPPELMSKDWIAERVSVVDIRRVLSNILLHRDDVRWGPNSKFIFPLAGGTGEIFRRLAGRLPREKLVLGKEVAAVDWRRRELHFADGSGAEYDFLINTMPLDRLIAAMPQVPEEVRSAAQSLVHNGVLVVGIGIRQECPRKWCWMYFPEGNCPFYRVTYFSNYSPNNVPGPGYYSLMCETSYSAHKPEDKGGIVQRTIDGLVAAGLLSRTDCNDIVSTWVLDAEYAYPVPSLERDRALSAIQAWLREAGIYSCGRFGGWRYEEANMDHSLMQGAELARRVAFHGDTVIAHV